MSSTFSCSTRKTFRASSCLECKRERLAALRRARLRTAHLEGFGYATGAGYCLST